MRGNIRLAVAAAFVAVASPAAAQSVSVGVSADDLQDRGTAATFGLEVRTAPLATLGTAPLRAGVAGEVDTRGDYFVGAGPTLTVPLTDTVSFDASVMPGTTGGRDDEVESEFAVRSRAALSVPLFGGVRGAVSVTHRSNVSDQVSVGIGFSTAAF